MANAAPSSVTQSSIHQNVDPYEVGWQFVPQYYTFVNKHPNRLHCFYTKNSTFIHGTEGEDGRPCFGQQEIHSKILSIGFQDCKVFIHSVDAQASAAGGIVIQVIGEMSNRGEAWRKFVQTFFLAEQPNGYFVLNDIFRFLKEESVEDEEEVEQPETLHEQPVPAAPAPQPEPDHTPTVNIPSSTPAPPEVPAEPVHEVAPEPPQAPEPAKPQANGVHPVEEKHVEPTPAEPEPVAVVEEEPERAAPAAPSPAPEIPGPVHSAPQEQKQPTPPPAQPTPSAPQPAAQPAAPPAPKTWANLAAANSKKWGAAVAQESRGTSEVIAPSPPASGTQTPESTAAPSPAPNARGGAQGHRGGHQHHSSFAASQTISSPHVFVKGVVDPLTNDQLRKALEKYGPLKDFEVVRSKACAFVEYTSVEAAKRAIAASLNSNQGGESGIRIPTGDDQQPVRITVETKKERGDRPPPRPRGGAPNQTGGERGGFRGGRGGGRGGRGGNSSGKSL